MLMIMAASSLSSIPPPPTAPFSSRYSPDSRRSIPILRASSEKHQIHESSLRFSASAILFLGLSLRACSPASARLPPLPIPVQDAESLGEEKPENVEGFKDDEMEVAFEAYKSKTYALSVPLKVVALRGSLPPSWIKEFISSQGKRVKFQPKFRASIEEIFSDLCMPVGKGKNWAASTAAADIVSIGDSWLSTAIKKRVVEPMNGVEDQDWYQGLSDKWKVYLRRNYAGERDPEGEMWAVPYRWGSMVIAYKKSKFQKHKLAPIKDWADLWRPELAGKISMVNSPREVVGAVLKYMGASYNTQNIDLQVPGGKSAVEKKLASLAKQVRLFDSTHYLKALSVGDVWVAVGWSSDVIPVVKRSSNVAVIVPASGTSLWADLWAIPAASRLKTDQIGGRIRGPSPLLHQWIEFCLQSARSVPFTQEVIPGASPSALDCNDRNSIKVANEPRDRTRLDTNLIAGVPPPEILSKCEFLEPLSDTGLSDYQSLISSLQKPEPGLADRIQDFISSVVRNFQLKLRPRTRET